MSSKGSSYQQGQLIRKEYHKRVLMIGGIRVFLPHSPVEARECVADVATEGIANRNSHERRIRADIRRYLVEGEEEENSAEMLKIFSQEVEQGITIALEAVVVENM
jgi:hypothetical protein